MLSIMEVTTWIEYEHLSINMVLKAQYQLIIVIINKVISLLTLSHHYCHQHVTILM